MKLSVPVGGELSAAPDIPVFSRCETAEPPSPARREKGQRLTRAVRSLRLPCGALGPDLLINLGLNHSSTTY